MNCPHCNQNLPGNPSATVCPACGRELTPATATIQGQLAPVKINWLWFLVALLGPPVLTLLSAVVDKNSNQGISPAFALIGGPLGGLACGIMLAMRSGTSMPARVILSFFFCSVMAVVCFILCFCGCAMGNYHMDMK